MSLMLNLTGLRYFHEVAKLGSIRRAAERLHVSPSAISRMITKIEHEFQADLFERRTKGVRLTAAGRLLATRLNGVFLQLQDVRTEIDELKGLRRGDITLYCIEGIVPDMVPSILSTFHRRYPAVTYNVYTAGTDHIVEALLGDTADLGIMFDRVRDPRIQVILSYTEPLHAMMSPAHALARRRSVSLRELAEYPVAMPDASYGVRRLLDRALHAKRIAMPMLLTTNSLELTRGLARSAVAITFMPPFAARRELASGELIAMPIVEKELLMGTMSVCFRRGRRLSAAASELIDVIADEFQALARKGAGRITRRR